MAATAAAIATAQDDEQGCVCSKMIWAYVLSTLGASCALTMGVYSVLNIMTFHGGVPGAILSVYTIVLGLVAVISELRSFVPFRSFVYPFVKQLYFVTMPIGRAIYYIFLGTIVFDPSEPFAILLGVWAMVVGLLMLGVNAKMGLPVYIDIQMIKDDAEEKLRAQQEEFDRRLLEARQGTPKFQADVPAVGAGMAAGATAAAAGGRQQREADDMFGGRDSRAGRNGNYDDDAFYDQK